nr:transposase [Bifidobacterium stellenboschense]
MRGEHQRDPLGGVQTQGTTQDDPHKQTPEDAAPLLRRWAADAFLSGIPGFVPLGEKIARRHFDILRTIHSGLSNARLEAVNNKIKTTIKIGYGYRKLDNLIGLVMPECGGLNLKLPGRNNQ